MGIFRYEFYYIFICVSSGDIIPPMEKKDIQKMISEIEKEDSIFSKKANLETLSFPPKIIGRQDKAKELVRILLSHRQGFVVPYVSVYGRSGCGKSTIVRYVCQNIDDVTSCFVNLRRAKTVFGCANLILAELGKQNLKSAQGINLAVDEIGKTISEILDSTKKNLFVLVLDELDVLFYDKRGHPSDFIYKLIMLEEKLKEKNHLMCIVGITNNVLSEYDLDERIRSRIGSSEIFFEAYSKKDVLSILQDRAKTSFAKPVDNSVLEYCAKISSSEHGDARRAIDLLRVGAEIAGLKNEPLSITHIDSASLHLQKDRIQQILSTSSFHFKLVSSALARVTFLSDEDWHATSSIFKQYCMIIKDEKPLGYRRVSEILVDIANSGIAVSNTGSKGRGGYGTQYKLNVSPEMIGKFCFAEWWAGVEKRKKEHQMEKKNLKAKKQMYASTGRRLKNLDNVLENLYEKSWSDFSGLDK